MTPIWMIDAVVHTLPGCTWDQMDRATSVFIECYVPVNDLQQALVATRKALLDSQFELAGYEANGNQLYLEYTGMKR